MTSDEAYTTIGVCLDSLECPTPYHRLWRAVIGQTLVDSLANKRRAPKWVGQGFKRRGALMSKDSKAEASLRYRNVDHNGSREEAQWVISSGWLQEMMPAKTADRLQAAIEWSWDEPSETRRRLIGLVSFKTKEAR